MDCEGSGSRGEGRSPRDPCITERPPSMGPLTLMRRTTEHSELVASASAATTSSPIDRVARFADCLYTDDGAGGDEPRRSVSHAPPLPPTPPSNSFPHT